MASVKLPISGSADDGFGDHRVGHGRHLRTLFSLNPAAYKARALGNLRVNGEPLPLAGHF